MSITRGGIGTLILYGGAALVVFSAVRAASIPATVTTTAAVSVTHQHAYRWFSNVDGLDPGSAAAAENAVIDAQSIGTQVRVRFEISNEGGAALPAGAIFRLQFANSTTGPWTDVASSSAWTFFDNPAVADGQIIATLFLSDSTVGESYGESNPSAAMPTQLLSGDIGEWDWSLVNAAATTTANWFFRMVTASGTPLDGYDVYPQMKAVPPSGGGPSGGGGSGGGGGGELVGGGPAYIPPGTSTATSSLPTTPPLLPPKYQVCDFNGDNHVDIVDLSILLYYYERTDERALRYDLNHNGRVDFPDVSVLMFYWKE